MNKKKLGFGITIILVALVALGIFATSPSGEKYVFENNKIVKTMQLKEQKQLDDVNNALKVTGIEPNEIKGWQIAGKPDSYGRIYYSFSLDGKKYNYGVWMNPNFTVHSIMYAGITLYEDGHLIEKADANIPSGEEMRHMQRQVEKVVKENLKAPSTAKFSDFKFRKVHGIGDVFGVVDSQNSFGAMIRTPFNASFDFNNNGVMTRIAIDGNELVKQ